MLSDLSVVGKWYTDGYNEERGWNFDEIEISPALKLVLEKSIPNIEVGKYSVRKPTLRTKAKIHHAYISAQDFLYVLKIMPLTILLADYFKILADLNAAHKTKKSLSALLKGPSTAHSVTNKLDQYSRENFYKLFRDADHRLQAKELVKEDDVRSDGMTSIMLKAIPCPDTNSQELAKIGSYFANDRNAFNTFAEEYIEYIPYIFKAKSKSELLFRILSTLGWMNKLDPIVGRIQITPGINKYPWGNFLDAFLLLNDPENKADKGYSGIPVHYSESLKKYIFFRKGLIRTEAAREEINTLLDQAWPGMSITESTEGGSTTYLYTSSRRKTSAKPLTGGRNEIIYGAPGTGKSHSIKQEIESENAAEITTVFHADTQYSDFVGSLKPKTAKENEATLITYEFRPGPFTVAYVEAVNNPSEKVYLVIEEINRAPAAAVFGEIFQLLDRNEKGESTYSIKLADPDMLAYIESETGKECSELRLPSNLFLSATMNSSDQAVMPMDTAFKRRWSFRYLEIDFTAPEVPDAEITLFLDEHGSEKEGNYTISWKDFAEKVINYMLKEFNVAEDRLIGPFFLNSKELSNPEAAGESLSGKLFPYIWDDVLRHMPNERARLFSDVQTYGDLYARFDQEQSVFSEEVAELTRNHGEKKDSGQDESA